MHITNIYLAATDIASKQPDFKADDRMTFFNDKRVETVHIRPVSPEAHVQVEVHEVVHITDAVIVRKMDEDGNVVEERRSESPPPTPVEPRPPRIEWRLHFDELPGIDIVTASTEQLGKLRRVLAECEGQFGEPA